LIDSGVRRDHPALRSTAIETFGCDGRSIPALHGTAVASLLVGQDGQFRGAAPGASLFAADAWCGDDAPGGRIEDIARSLAWLASHDVSVINLSLVGPPNVVLETLVKRVQARGIVLVAAAGNDGPNAPPLYPAAYAGVVAVTAVDARHKVLLEAARGKHIRFAAPGADLVAAALTPDYLPVRGTSFAAPLVAGLIATQMTTVADGTAALVTLSQQARDLGRKGRDDVYGEGVLGEQFARPLAAAAVK
jgi:subtilisin family serine protease